MAIIVDPNGFLSLCRFFLRLARRKKNLQKKDRTYAKVSFSLRQHGTLRFLYVIFHPGGVKNNIQKEKIRGMRKS